MTLADIINHIKFNADGLAPIVVQDEKTRDILMLAWASKESIEKTIATGEMHYWSRSRNKIWRKGETSGQEQELVELSIDCDMDSLLAIVKQKGVACHTGRKNCFYFSIKENKLVEKFKPDVDPKSLYGNSKK